MNISTKDYDLYQEKCDDKVMAYLKLGRYPGITVNVDHVPEQHRETFAKLLHMQVTRALDAAYAAGANDARAKVRKALGLSLITPVAGEGDV